MVFKDTVANIPCFFSKENLNLNDLEWPRTHTHIYAKHSKGPYQQMNTQMATTRGVHIDIMPQLTASDMLMCPPSWKSQRFSSQRHSVKIQDTKTLHSLWL